MDELLARTSSGGTTAWYLTDKLGSVRDIVSSSGTELDHIVYDSFGNILTETNAANGDRFKYAGMEYDSATGQYYDRARYYNPAGGRFERTDPTFFAAGDSNLYRYAGNGPTDSVDPFGTTDSGGGQGSAYNVGLAGLLAQQARNRARTAAVGEASSSGSQRVLNDGTR